MTDIATKVRSIVETRQQNDKTDEAINKINQVKKELEKCSSVLQKILGTKIPQGKREKASEFKEKLTKFINEDISDSIKRLSQLHNRFSRSTLNIGIVGNARQGKSTFIQQLTGLSDEEIPAGNGPDCTGAASIIVNKQPDNGRDAEIEYYTIDEFIETVRPYYQKFVETFSPNDLDEFSRPLSELLDSDKLGKYKDTNEFAFLEKLQKDLNIYRDKLGSRKEWILKSEIRKYTAKSDSLGKPLILWAAVKKATVYCSFPNLEGVPISLGDTPGLGDPSAVADFAEKRLMKNFAEDIDQVIMLRLVNVGGIRGDDKKVFRLIGNAIDVIPAETWSYFLVNMEKEEYKTDKARDAKDDDLDGHDPLKPLTTLRRTYKESELRNMQQYIEVDCKNRDLVFEKFQGILEIIGNTQLDLDDKLYTARLNKIQEFFKSIADFAKEELLPFLKEYESGEIVKHAAEDRFDEEVWGNLRGKLTDLKQKYKDKSGDENAELKESVETIKKKKNDDNFLVKSLEEIIKASKANPSGWHGEEMEKLRVALGKEIGKIGADLAKQFDVLRQEVKTFLLEEGQLKDFLPPEQKEESQWWETLAQKMESQLSVSQTAKDIAAAIRCFKDATLSYEQLLEPRIMLYGCLDYLDRNTDRGKPYDHLPSDTPVSMREKLLTAIRESLQKTCSIFEENEIKDGVPRCILVEPSAALHSTLEKFYLTTFVDKLSEKYWKRFYGNYCDDIWGTDKPGVPQSIVREWDNNVNGLLEACK